MQICGDREDRFLKPIEIFNETTNFEDQVTKIRCESIRYAKQNGTQFTVDNEELKAYLGMNFVMGYNILTSIRDCWSTAPDMAVPYISNIMPRNTFEHIRKKLHFCNNVDQPERNSANYDRAYKIRPIMDHLNS